MPAFECMMDGNCRLILSECRKVGRCLAAHPMEPLNGTKTHPLKPGSLAVLRKLRSGPMPRQEMNPGVANRLLRSGYVESYRGPSPYRTKPGEREYLRITEAGVAILTEEKPAGRPP